MEYISISKEDTLNFIDFLDGEDTWMNFHLTLNYNINGIEREMGYSSFFSGGEFILFIRCDEEDETTARDFKNSKLMKNKIEDDFENLDIKSIDIYPSPIFKRWNEGN